MTVRYYQASVVPLFAQGGGRFSLSEPGRPVYGSRCLLYTDWNQLRGTRCTVTEKWNNEMGDTVCICRVEAPNRVHTLIRADKSITIIERDE